MLAAAIFGLYQLATIYAASLSLSPKIQIISAWSFFIAILIFVLLLTPLFYALIMGKINSAAERSNVSICSLSKRFWPLVAVYLLVSIFNIIGFCVVIIPGIFLCILLIAAMPVVLIEHKGPWQSIKRSCQLVWGNWWYTFFTILIGLICIFLLYFLVAVFIAGWLMLVLYLTHNHHVLATTHAIMNVVSPILSAFILIQLTYSLIVELYHCLRLRYQANEQLS